MAPVTATRQRKAETGVDVVLHTSHGGSAGPARAVIDGLEADVVRTTRNRAIQQLDSPKKCSIFLFCR